MIPVCVLRCRHVYLRDVLACRRCHKVRNASTSAAARRWPCGAATGKRRDSASSFSTLQWRSKTGSFGSTACKEILADFKAR
jgi:hypothetical protein